MILIGCCDMTSVNWDQNSNCNESKSMNIEIKLHYVCHFMKFLASNLR